MIRCIPPTDRRIGKGYKYTVIIIILTDVGPRLGQNILANEQNCDEIIIVILMELLSYWNSLIAVVNLNDVLRKFYNINLFVIILIFKFCMLFTYSVCVIIAHAADCSTL